MNSIKKITSENDLLHVHKLAHSIWPECYKTILSKAQLNYMLLKIYSLPALSADLASGTQYFLMFNEFNIPIGFSSITITANESCKLNKLYLLTNLQGKGLGKQLFLHAVEQAKIANVPKLNLQVNRHNNALAFYKAQGMHIVEEADFDIGNGYFMNDYIMQLNLLT